MTDQRNDQTQVERAIARALAQGRISRRRFLRQAGKGGLITASALSLPAILAACGINPGGSGSQGASAQPASLPAEPAGTLIWANWPAYIDIDEESGEYPTIQRVHRTRPASRSATARTSTTTRNSSVASSLTSRRATRRATTSSSSPTG